MTQHRYSITMDATHEIESLIERFEQDRRERFVDLGNYLPAPSESAYGAVVTELSRIDMEHAFEQGQNGEASTYINAYPDVFKDDRLRAQIAFEEFRLRRWAGDSIEAAQLAQQYQVDASHWPKLEVGRETKSRRDSTYGKISRENVTAPVVHYPRVGETFAGYPLIDRLGEGAFSRVFLARQPDLAGRPVVLKITPLATDESDRLARLQHTAIIPVYSVHRNAELSCICMPFLGVLTLADFSPSGERWASLEGPAEELVSTIVHRRRSTIRSHFDPESESHRAAESATSPTSDRDLHSVLNRPVRGSLSRDESVAIKQLSQLGYVEALLALVTGAVEGLAHAHQHGVIHRDLKPANILVSDEGSPVLLDFNLAVDRQEPRTRIVGGTLPYMSPQQLMALETGEPPDSSDDVFSMGVILYELLTGQLPFDCPNEGKSIDLDRMIENRRCAPISLRSLNRGVSVGLEAIINKCYAPDRDDRYHDASQLLEDLNRHRQNRPLRFAPNHSWKERLSKWSSRHPRIASGSSVATLATLLLLLCGFLIHYRGERIATLKAEAHRQGLRVAMPSLVATLSTPGREPEILQNGLSESSRVLGSWLDDNQLSIDSGVAYLNQDSQQSVRQDLAQLTYLMAEAETDLGLASSGHDATADLHYERSLKWNRTSSDLSSEFSLLSKRQRERITAKHAGTEVPQTLPDSFESLQPELQAIAAAGSSGDAERLLELSHQQLQHQPTNVSLWFYWAVANARLGRWQAAITGLDVCDAMLPGSIAILFNRGLSHLQGMNAEAARDDFSACLVINPEMMTARFNRAVAEERLGNLESALHDLDHLLTTGRATTRMWLMRARVHQRLGHDQAALADREAAMTVPPQDANDWVARGVARLANSPSEALDDFLAALRLAPNDFHALQNAAHVYAERLNDTTHAIEMLDRLVVAFPNDASAVASRGILLARTGKAAPALADAMAASERQPGPREQLQIAGIYALTSAQPSVHPNGESGGSVEDARAAAMQWLRASLRNDPTLGETARGDSDLTALRSDNDFNRLIESALTLESRP